MVHLNRLMAQFANFMEMEVLPPIHPTPQVSRHSRRSRGLGRDQWRPSPRCRISPCLVGPLTGMDAMSSPTHPHPSGRRRRSVCRSSMWFCLHVWVAQWAVWLCVCCSALAPLSPWVPSCTRSNIWEEGKGSSCRGERVDVVLMPR